MPIFQETTDAVANSNFKVIAEGPTVGASIAQSLMSVDAVNQQRMVNTISNAALMEALGQRAGIDVAEAAGTGIVSASGTADLMAQMGGLTAALQQVMKAAQTTPPVT